MKRVVAVWCMCFGICYLFGSDQATKGSLSEVCRFAFPVETQAGKMDQYLAVCTLVDDRRGADTSLYIVTSYEREYPPQIIRIIKQAHTPILEEKEGKISILYTSGANATCVDTYSVTLGEPKYSSTETIAWNDGGIYRTSDSFENYAHLLKRRHEHIKVGEAIGTRRSAPQTDTSL